MLDKIARNCSSPTLPHGSLLLMARTMQDFSKTIYPKIKDDLSTPKSGLDKLFIEFWN